MTDCPRFAPVRGTIDTAHLNYHGGAVVDAVLMLANKWARYRDRASGRIATTLIPRMIDPIKPIRDCHVWRRGDQAGAAKMPVPAAPAVAPSSVKFTEDRIGDLVGRAG